jgi:hypothetical protein
VALPGMTIGPLLGTFSPPSPSSLTYITYTYTPTNPYPNHHKTPAASQAGDLCVVMAIRDTGSTPVIHLAYPTTPGWIPLAKKSYDSGSTHVSCMAAYKVLTSGGAQDIETMIERSSAVWVILVRPDRAINEVTTSWTQNISTGNPSAQTVAVSSLTKPVLVLALGYRNSTSTPPSWNLSRSPATAEYFIGHTNYTEAALQIYNSSPINHTFDIDDRAQVNILQSGYFMVS